MGVTYEALNQWREKDPKFSEEVELARLASVKERWDIIQAAARGNADTPGDWHAAAWSAERTWPADFGKPEAQLNVQTNVQNVTNEIHITFEVAERLDNRGREMEVEIERLLENRKSSPPRIMSANAPPKKGKLRDTPLSFAEIILKTPVYDWQGKILFAIEKGAALNRFKVAVVAPNGSGKSERLVAIAALRWLYRFPKGKVIVTSADSRQLDLQVMPALRKHSGVFRRWEFLSRQVRTPENGFLNAFTTDESGRAEGHHSAPDTPLLIIADEAKSIPEPIFEAIDRCSFNTLLLISSPGLMQGRFYNCFTSHRAEWLTFQVGLKDCPHVSQERIDDVVNSVWARASVYSEHAARRIHGGGGRNCFRG